MVAPSSPSGNLANRISYQKICLSIVTTTSLIASVVLLGLTFDSSFSILTDFRPLFGTVALLSCIGLIFLICRNNQAVTPPRTPIPSSPTPSSHPVNSTPTSAPAKAVPIEVTPTPISPTPPASHPVSGSPSHAPAKAVPSAATPTPVSPTPSASHPVNGTPSHAPAKAVPTTATPTPVSLTPPASHPVSGSPSHAPEKAVPSAATPTPVSPTPPASHPVSGSPSHAPAKAVPSAATPTPLSPTPPASHPVSGSPSHAPAKAVFSAATPTPVSPTPPASHPVSGSPSHAPAKTADIPVTATSSTLIPTPISTPAKVETSTTAPAKTAPSSPFMQLIQYLLTSKDSHEIHSEMIPPSIWNRFKTESKISFATGYQFGETMIETAVLNDDVQALEFLCEGKSEYQLHRILVNANKDLVASAAERGSLGCLQILQNNFHILEWYQTQGHDRAILQALNANQTHCVVYLLRYNIQPKLDHRLREIFWKGKEACLKPLIEKYPATHEMSRMAAFTQDLDLLRWLISSGRFDMNVTHPLGSTPLLYMVSSSDIDIRHKEQMLTILLDLSPSLEVTDSRGNTVFHSVRNADQAILERLITYSKKGIDTKNREGDTPLHEAIKWRAIQKALILIANGANVLLKNNKGQTPLELLRTQFRPIFEKIYLRRSDADEVKPFFDLRDALVERTEKAKAEGKGSS